MRTSLNARRWAAGTAVSTLLMVGLGSVSNAAEAKQDKADLVAAATRYGQPNLYTSDVDKMLNFYSKALGFTVEFRFPAEGPGMFGTVSKEGTYYITFSSYDTIKTYTGLPHIGKSTHKQSDVAVIVSNVDQAYNKAKKAGAKALMAPKDQPWGERQAYVADPEGNFVQLSTHTDH